MAEFYMGQIMMTGFGYAPKFFARCDGGILPISQNAALYSLLGIVYGGDGSTNFKLPDLRGRAPVGGGFPSLDPSWTAAPYVQGQIGGVEQVQLTADQNGQHTHLMMATTGAGGTAIPTGTEVFAATETALYGPPDNLIPLGGGPTSSAGSGQPHNNMQPFETINFNIALSGIYPSRQ